MKNYIYNNKSNLRFAIKGELSTDGETIYYTDSDKNEKEISVAKCFAKFCGMPVEISISSKTQEDLEDTFEIEEG